MTHAVAWLDNVDPLSNCIHLSSHRSARLNSILSMFTCSLVHETFQSRTPKHAQTHFSGGGRVDEEFRARDISDLPRLSGARTNVTFTSQRSLGSGTAMTKEEFLPVSALQLSS